MGEVWTKKLTEGDVTAQLSWVEGDADGRVEGRVTVGYLQALTAEWRALTKQCDAQAGALRISLGGCANCATCTNEVCINARKQALAGEGDHD